MSLFAGILRIEDLNVSLQEFDEPVISSAIDEVLQTFQTERNQAANLFVAEQTTNPTERVRQAGVDEGQELGPDGRPLETHVGGYYSVGYPIKRIGWALGWNRETFAHMTVADLDREVSAKLAGNARRHTKEVLKAIFNNVNGTYVDELAGDITVRRLANSDGTLYGANETQDNHYLVSQYANNAISGTNNPFASLYDEIAEHFDTDVRVVAFINSAQRSEVLNDLTTFVDAPIEGIVPANSVATAIDPGLNVPGEFLGIDQASGVYVYVWDRIPASYVYAQAVDLPGPIKRRVPAPTMLQGFTQIEEERHFPFYKRQWVELFGYGVGNRLSAAVMFLDAGSSYTVPSI